MANKLPWIFSGSKVCIICEGDEEYEYLDKLISLDVWNENYKFTLENAEGNGNIPARYQDKYQNGSYDVVLVFCDTDRKPYEQYVDIKRKINEFHGVENAADKVVIYGNPCTMQIIIEHWDEIMLKSHQKKKNAPIIFELTGVENYKGREDQRQELFYGITTIVSYGILFEKKSSYILMANFLGAISNIILNILLIPEYGISAAAATTCLGYLITFIVTFIFAQKCYHCSYNIRKAIIVLILTYITLIADSNCLLLVRGGVWGVMLFVLLYLYRKTLFDFLSLFIRKRKKN